MSTTPPPRESMPVDAVDTTDLGRYRHASTSRWSALAMRFLPLAPIVAVAGAAWFVLTNDPTDGRREVTGPCTWHALTGINGPSCGGTRAFYYLVHGNLVEALRFHAPLVIAAPIIGYWWLSWVLQTWFGIRIPRLRPRRWMIVTFVVASVVFTTVLRNLPVPGLSWFDIPNLTPHML